MGVAVSVSMATAKHTPLLYSTAPPFLEAVAVTHHSVELAWRDPSHTTAVRPLYTVQEEEAGRSRGFTNIYRYK